VKKKINETLEQLLVALKKLPLSSQALQALSRAAPTSQKPVVRQRAYLHVFEWIKRQGSDGNLQAIDEALPTIQKIIVMGLTDVWSATRKACAEKLCGFAAMLSVSQIESLFQCILDAYARTDKQKAEDNKDKWKQKEGCLLGLNSIIKQFSWTSNHDAGEESMIRLRSAIFPTLPPFITRRLKGMLFEALAHSQVSVRETAVKAFSSYLQRTSMEESFSCLDEIKNKLAGVALMCDHEKHGDDGINQSDVAQASRASSSSSSNGSHVPRAWEKLSDWNCLSAYFRQNTLVLIEACEAQGLLSLCNNLFRTIPSSHLVAHWPILFPTINMYLAHSASTVRQACSSLFEVLMAKADEASPMLQRLVLQSMAMTCKASTSADRHTEAEGGQHHLQDNHILSSPAKRRLQQEHRLDSPHRKTEDSSRGHSDRCGDTAAPIEVTQGALWSSWEWREGRLLAYELLLGHLVKDHTKKMFLCDPTCLSPTKTPPPHELSQPPDMARRHAAPTPPSDQQLLHSPGPMVHPASTMHSAAAASSPGAPLMSSPGRLRDGAHELSLLDTLREADAADKLASPLQQEHVVGHLRFQSFDVNLETIFAEVLNCAGDVRWELRRMALQVLPLLTVAALWYNFSLLEDLWRRWLLQGTHSHTSKEPPRAYVAALSVKEVRMHVCTRTWFFTPV
jgi:hypothetical protein